LTLECSKNWKWRWYEPLRLALVLALLLTTAGPAARACGYHDNVSVARGALNWSYPDSLYVVGAISRAVAERRLPPPNFDASRRDLFGSRYRKSVRSLQRLGEALNSVPDRSSAPPFALVLVEPMMWTRFSTDQAGLHAEVHVAAPSPGDLVVVSGEAVIAKIAEGRLAIGEAHRLGLLRLYGAGSQPTAFLTTFKDVGGKRLAASHH
jgi:hypothetical protein